MAAAITRLPNELLLHIFTYLTLKSLIASYGVCGLWRKLVPTSLVLPNRLDLFRLYLEVVSSPCFPKTRPWTLKMLQPFDRDAYVATLLEQHNYLPEAFRLWVLEWPALAVFGCVWPGLPSIEIAYDVADGFERLRGRNWLCSGQVSVLGFDTDSAALTPNEELIPGLLVRSCNGGYNTWLMLDEREGVRDKVYQIEGEELWEEDGKDGEEPLIKYENWIEFQRAMWREIEKVTVIERERETNKSSFLSGIFERGGCPGRIPARPWVRGQGRAIARRGFKREE